MFQERNFRILEKSTLHVDIKYGTPG